jgi:uncharacterized membrane protein YgcG
MGGIYTAHVSEDDVNGLTPPGGLRPAQLGIVLVGRVILGHISATLVDLAQRDYLRIEAVPGGEHWLLTDLRDKVSGRDALLPFEVTLLDGLFALRSRVLVPGDGRDLVPVINKVRTLLRRDAVRRGWLRRLRPEHRTPSGEQLLRQIHDFRGRLRAQIATANPEVSRALVPYAMIFGIPMPSEVGTDATLRLETVGQRGFGTVWQQAFVNSSDHRHPSGENHSGDFAHRWSAPHDHDHDHGSYGHGQGHGGYGGDYGHGGFGGHGGGFGGGHGGH